jgi:hypothetical protein
MHTTEQYLLELYLVEDLNLIEEGLGDAIKKMASNKKEKIVASFKKAKDVNAFKAVAKMTPKFPKSQAGKIAAKIDPKFEKKKRRAEQEMPKVPVKVKGAVASIVALSAKDDGQLNQFAKKANAANWENATSNLIYGILFSIIIAGVFSVAFGAPFSYYLGIFLLIDLIFFVIEGLFMK